MPPVAPNNSWPSHWYNMTDNHLMYGIRLVCPAEGCDIRFNEDNFKAMKAHWYHEYGRPTDPSSHTLNDHVILFAMSHQTVCIHCKVPHGNLRNLLAHEQEEHSRTEMSTVGKYLALVRKGDMTFPHENFEVYAHNRLVSKIAMLPALRDAILEYGLDGPNISLTRDEEKTKSIATFLEKHNTNFGRRRYEVIPQEYFLAHKRPQSKHDGTDWPQRWAELRSMYAQGKI